MHRFPHAAAAAILCMALSLIAIPLLAGTQDFVLVNDTGETINNLYMSETSNNDWEEDVLGRDVLGDRERLNMTFEGRSACLWDIKAVNRDGDSLEWTAINLCKVSVVVLICDDDECWAEFE